MNNTVEIKVNHLRNQLSYSINLSDAIYPWQIREGIQEALRLAGYDEGTIDEVFHQMPDMEQSGMDMECNEVDENKEEEPPTWNGEAWVDVEGNIVGHPYETRSDIGSAEDSL